MDEIHDFLSGLHGTSSTAPLSEETDQADDFLTRLLYLDDDADDDDALHAILSSIQTIRQNIQYVVDVSDILKTIVIERKEDGDKCSICLEEFEVGKEAKITECMHVFHEDCLV